MKVRGGGAAGLEGRMLENWGGVTADVNMTIRKVYIATGLSNRIQCPVFGSRPAELVQRGRDAERWKGKHSGNDSGGEDDNNQKSYCSTRQQFKLIC